MHTHSGLKVMRKPNTRGHGARKTGSSGVVVRAKCKLAVGTAATAHWTAPSGQVPHYGSNVACALWPVACIHMSYVNVRCLTGDWCHWLSRSDSASALITKPIDL